MNKEERKRKQSARKQATRAHETAGNRPMRKIFPRILGWAWILALQMVLGYGEPGCSQDAQIIDKTDQCADVDCSGHGQCAVLESDHPICICDAGWHADGLSCAQDVPGEECSGVDCSGHGTCVVVQGDPSYPLCVCDSGYRAEANTNCVAVSEGLTCGPGTVAVDGQCIPEDQCPNGDCTPDICNSSADCAEGQVCLFESGACVDSSTFQCAPPQLPEGSVEEGDECEYLLQGELQHCAPGLRCVPQRLVMNEDGTYVPTPTEVHANSDPGSVCLRSCDPCAGDCEEGSHCIALEDGGGFCAPKPLGVEGDLCRMGTHEVAWCEAGTMCFPGPNPMGASNPGYCVKYCTPDDPSTWSSRDTGWATTSQDCGPGQACLQAQASLIGNTWVCRDGEIVPIGGGCGVGHDNEYCEYPSECQNITNGGPDIPGTCSIKNADDCPPPAHLRFVGLFGIPEQACILPGAVGFGGFCDEDEDCESGLTCQDLGGYHSRCWD